MIKSKNAHISTPSSHTHPHTAGTFICEQSLPIDEALRFTPSHLSKWTKSGFVTTEEANQTPTFVLKVPVAPFRLVCPIRGVPERSFSGGSPSSFALAWPAAAAPSPTERGGDNVNLTTADDGILEKRTCGLRQGFK